MKNEIKDVYFVIPTEISWGYFSLKKNPQNTDIIETDGSFRYSDVERFSVVKIN